MNKQTQSGFAVVELVIAVVIIAVIVVVGYVVFHHKNGTSNPTTASTASTISSYKSPTTSTPPAPQINNAADLNSAMTAINQAGISSNNTDSNQLSTYSSGF